MSKVTDDSLRPHLTALIDGELQPLEAIALKQRMRQSPELSAECQELERLKVAVHLAGTRDPAPDALKRSLEAMCQRHFDAQRKKQARWTTLWVPLGLAASAAVGLLVAFGGGAAGPEGPRATPPQLASITVAPAVVLPTDPNELLPRLAGFHRESESPLALADLKNRGALLAIERLPDTFITPEGTKPQLVQASWMGCNERQNGSTLAVLRADRVRLPPIIESALDATGVFVDIIDGVHVRLSVSGDKLFVLLSTDPGPNQSPI